MAYHAADISEHEASSHRARVIFCQAGLDEERGCEFLGLGGVGVVSHLVISCQPVGVCS
jgi:hypothetical protein